MRIGIGTSSPKIGKIQKLNELHLAKVQKDHPGMGRPYFLLFPTHDLPEPKVSRR